MVLAVAGILLAVGIIFATEGSVDLTLTGKLT